MHIPDNYLSPSTCAAFAVVMVPIWRKASIKVKNEMSKRKMPLLGVAAAFSFLVMMFNAPIPGGTTAHAIGGALIAILLGPYAAVLAITVALVIQAIFFGDGGILAIGVNCFNMAFVIPFVAFNLFNFFKKISKSKKGEYFGVFLSGYISINVAALFAAIEFGIQPLLFKDALGRPLYSPYSLKVSIPAMLIPHLLVAGVIEGVIAVGVYSYVKKAAPDIIYKGKEIKNKFLYAILGILILAVPLGLLANGTAWGEWNLDDMKKLIGYVPNGMSKGFKFNSPFKDYSFSFLNQYFGYVLSALVGVVLILAIFKFVERINLRRNKKEIR